MKTRDPRDDSGKFPAGTEFFSVNGRPVANVPHDGTMAFDTFPPRWDSMASVAGDGESVTEAAFMGLPRYVATAPK